MTRDILSAKTRRRGDRSVMIIEVDMESIKRWWNHLPMDMRDQIVNHITDDIMRKAS